MLSNKWRPFLTQAVMGYVLCVSSLTVSAANGLLAPYGVFNIGPRLRVGWPEGIELFTGPGALYNPSVLDDWFLSAEFLYYRHVRTDGTEEKGGFLLGKVALPWSEGKEFYIKPGIGGLWLIHDSTKDNSKDEKKGECNFTIAGTVCVGHSWHTNNGYYLNLQATYIYPFSENSKRSISVQFGPQWNLI